VFFKIGEIDFSQYENYAVGDRQSLWYFIHYEGRKFLAFYPVDSTRIVELNRVLTEHEIDSLSQIGIHRFKEQIDIDAPITLHLQGICDVFQSIWRIDPVHIFLGSLFVNTEHDALMCVIWKPTDEMYWILFSDKNNTSLKQFDNIIPGDSTRLSNGNYFREIRPGLYYCNEGKYMH
jgi:hypothetical protein